MSDERPEEAEALSPEELAEQEAAPLPDRELMSILDANVSIPVDPSVAADVLDDEDLGAEVNGVGADGGDEAAS